MSLLSRLRNNQPTTIRLTPADPSPAPVDLRPQLEHAQQRAYAAEDATRAMQTRLDAAIAGRRAALVAQVDAEGRAHQLTDRVRELGSEVAALRVLLERAQAPRGEARLCTVCHDPMPTGFAHHCRRTSEYREDAA